MVHVTITDNTTAWASAIPRSPIPLLGKPPFTTTTAAPMNTRAKVPSASAATRRGREGMRGSLSCSHESRVRSLNDPLTLLRSPKEQRRVDSAEPERIAQQVIGLQLESLAQ